MVEISKSGSGEGPGSESSRGYSTAASPRTPPGRDLFYVPDVGMAKRRIGLRALPLP